MRQRRRAPAGGVQAEKQRRFVRLIAQGVSNAEACRLVGINRRTGTRWRYGRSVLNSGGEVLHYAPVTITPEKPRSCRYLSEQERVMIADLLAVRELLGQRWSPEQVGHELAVRFAGQRRRCLCTESIYQAIYDPGVGVTRPARRRRRRRRLRGEHRRGRLVAMRMIAERPVEVQDRVQAGHWEGDLIMGTGNRSAIGTLVERSTRYLILLHLHDGVSSAETVAEALGSALGSLPTALRRTLTWDQGKELAQHQQVTATAGTSVFFCDPHSPWQRGSNENMNGLLRDYFPKGIDLTAFTASALEQVAVEVNRRPRKTLGWSRPADLFSSALVSCA